MPLPLQARLLRVLEEKEVTESVGIGNAVQFVRSGATQSGAEKEMKQGVSYRSVLSPEHFTPQAAAATRAVARYPAAGGRFFKTVAGRTGCAVF